MEPLFMTRGTQRRLSVFAVGAVVIAVAIDLAMLGLCVTILRSSYYLSVAVEEGLEGCHWRTKRHVSHHQNEDETIPQGACMVAVTGILVEQLTFVRDPSYIATQAEYRSWLASQALLAERLSGVETATLVLTTTNGKELTVQVPVSGFSWERVDLTVWVTLLTGLATVIFGCWVFLRRPSHAASRLLMAFSHGMYICAVVTTTYCVRGIGANADSINAMYWANQVAFFEAAAALMLLAIWFPEPWFSPRLRRVMVFLLLLAGVGAYSLTSVGISLGAAMMQGGGLVVLGALIMVLLSQFRRMAQLRRAQARWVLWGLAMPSLLWAITRIPYLVGVTERAPPTDELLFLFAATIPVGLGVAILRYRLLDIKVIIRRTVVGTGVVTLVLTAYSVLFSAFATGVTEQSGTSSSHAVAIVSAIILAFTVLPAQSRLEEAIDRLFFRNQYHYRRLLARTPDHLADLHRPQDVADAVLKQTCTSMEIPRMVVALPPDGTEPHYWIREDSADGEGTEGQDSRVLPPPPTEALWQDLREATPENLFDPSRADEPLHQWLKDGRLDIAFPLRTSESLVGAMACAAPRHARLIAPNDVAVLRTVAASLALALSRARAFEELQRVNEGLETTVATRTAELEKTRLQLFQWEKMASLGVLAAGVAHELNTPLEVVSSTSEQLVDHLGQQNPKQIRSHKLAVLCLDAVRRADQIVRDLSNFSRPESQDVQLLELPELIDSTLRILGHKLRKANVTANVEFDELPTVRGYGALVAQTVANLVLNAIAAIERDGTIEISARCADSDHVVIVVQDSGPGIPPELRGRVFEPFFTTQAPGQGLGLGLSLCHTFVTQHGGRIWEEGRQGEGARFVVELPISVPSELREHHLSIRHQHICAIESPSPLETDPQENRRTQKVLQKGSS
jgi:signal transduction histidine kinase